VAGAVAAVWVRSTAPAALPVLNIVHVLNRGVAFSVLHDAGGWQQFFFIAVLTSTGGRTTDRVQHGGYFGNLLSHC
jgi:signal peptidase II